MTAVPCLAVAGEAEAILQGSLPVKAPLAVDLALALEFDGTDVEPLHVARDADTVRALVARGSDVNALTTSKECALHYAARSNDKAMVLALLEAGAVKGDHARAVLTAVLEHEQAFVELGGDLAFVAKYADDAAHARDVPVDLLTGEIVRRGETREMRAVSVRGHTHGAFRGSREKQTIAFLTMP